MHSRWRRFPWKGWFPVSRNFYSRTCVKFTFANEIEAKHLRSLVSVKVEPRTWLKFTWVNLRSQKRVSGNQPEDRSYAGHNLMDVYKMVDLSNLMRISSSPPRAFFFPSPQPWQKETSAEEKRRPTVESCNTSFVPNAVHFRQIQSFITSSLQYWCSTYHVKQ